MKENQKKSAFRVFMEKVFALRGVLLSVPVAAAAGLLAWYNYRHLPDPVGLFMQRDGSFSVTLAKSMAVAGPVAITALCLILTICSKKVTYPWLISIFSLVIPVILLLMNMI